MTFRKLYVTRLWLGLETELQDRDNLPMNMSHNRAARNAYISYFIDPQYVTALIEGKRGVTCPNARDGRRRH